MTKVLDNKVIGHRIKELRVEKHIGQTALAKDIGISQTHMSNIETGKVGLTLENSVRMAQVFGCSLDELVLGNKSDNIGVAAVPEEKDLLNEFTLGDVVQALQLLKNKEVKFNA